MTKRIEQSRRHGHYDPRWTVAYENSPTNDDVELPVDVPPPPTLVLVGGTDFGQDVATAGRTDAR